MAKQGYARQAITTRSLGPTQHRGARVVARCDAGTMTVAWDDGLDVWGNHRDAALTLARKMGWGEAWIGGSTRDGYAFVDAGKAY